MTETDITPLCRGPAVEPAIVRHPARHNWINPIGELVEFKSGAPMDPPFTDLLTHCLEGLRADCGQERRERFAVRIPRLPRGERKPQERERGVFVEPRLLPSLQYTILVLSGCSCSPTCPIRSPIAARTLRA